MNKISKLKMYVVLACAANFVVYVIYNVYSFSPRIRYSSYSQIDRRTLKTTLELEISSNRDRSDSTPDQQHQLRSPQLKKNIFFLKTHKTGSSTIQNILMRFGLRHSLNFLLPKENNYLGYKKPIGPNDIDSKSMPSDRKFNIFAHHSRYRRRTSEFLYPDTLRVTILRDPPELYESAFGYYKFEKLLNLSFGDLVKSLPRTRDFKMGTRKVQGRNQMSRDLGLEISQYENSSEITNFIHSIDDDFDLVMIKEHMEASLVLLARLMGWPLHYVACVSINRRTSASQHVLSETDRLTLSQYNRADHLLYEYFLDKFKHRIIEYGFERMVADMQELHLINSRLKMRCILNENTSGYADTIGYTLKDNADWECVYSTKEELKFTTELRKEQITRLQPVRRLQQLMKSVSDGR